VGRRDRIALARRRKKRFTEPLAPGWPTVLCEEPSTPRTITGGRRSGPTHDPRNPSARDIILGESPRLVAGPVVPQDPWHREGLVPRLPPDLLTAWCAAVDLDVAAAGCLGGGAVAHASAAAGEVDGRPDPVPSGRQFHGSARTQSDEDKTLAMVSHTPNADY
jgi:hypothetical protein